MLYEKQLSREATCFEILAIIFIQKQFYTNIYRTHWCYGCKCNPRES